MRIIVSATLSATIDIVVAPPNAPSNMLVTLKGPTMSTAQFTWVDPTARADGTVLAPSEIAGINIFDSAASDPSVPINSTPVAAGVQKFTTGTLTVGVHSFTLKTTDTTGHVSVASAPPASVTVPATLAPPNPPSNVTVTLNP